MVDPILSAWILIWTSISSYGLYLILTEDKRASAFYVYGKSLDVARKKGLFWRLFLVPKRFFRHFYSLALIFLWPSIFIVVLYYVPSQPNKKLLTIIETFKSLTEGHISFVAPKDLTVITSLLFTTILLVVQCSRRLYESFFISVYSKNSKINLLHYIFGNTFYLLATISTILPILLSDTSNKYSLNDFMNHLVTKRRAVAFVLFIYASHCQHKCHIILANLRKDKSGRVITEQHYVPSGGLFEFVSCPHFLLEVILYFIITLVQEFSVLYWNLIFALVLTTQTINAIIEHRWYKKKYKDYPKERRAIFPKLL